MKENLGFQEVKTVEYPVDKDDQIKLLDEQPKRIEEFPEVVKWVEDHAENNSDVVELLKSSLLEFLTRALEFVDHNDVLSKNSSENVEQWAKEKGFFDGLPSADHAVILVEIQQKREEIVKEVIRSKIEQGDMRAVVWVLERVNSDLEADARDYTDELSRMGTTDDKLGYSPEEVKQKEGKRDWLQVKIKNLHRIESVIDTYVSDIKSLVKDEEAGMFGKDMNKALLGDVDTRIKEEIGKIVKRAEVKK